MKFHLYKVSGYEEAIMSLRMSHGKYFSWEKARQIQELVHIITDEQGFVATSYEYQLKLKMFELKHNPNPKITGNYDTDVEEFKRLLGLTMNNAMVQFTHHTLMKYIDISFFTDGLHRGAQDDLDAHAIAFNNRITRYSTRLAEIDEPKLSEWYQDKVIPFDDAIKHHNNNSYEENEVNPPQQLDVEGQIFKYTPFGYIHEQYADMSHKSGLYKDVQRGLIPLGQAGAALWKSDMFNLRYVYHMRSKLTKANPELKQGMEQLADQIEQNVPVFGEYFRKVFTDTGKWEHTNRTKTVTREEYDLLQKINLNKSEKES